MIVSDVLLFPSGSYTHVNNTSHSRPWIDHCLSSSLVHTSIRNIYIDTNCVDSDHFPLHVLLQVDTLPYFDANGANENNNKNQLEYRFSGHITPAYFRDDENMLK